MTTMKTSAVRDHRGGAHRTHHLVVSGYSEGASGVFDLSVSFQEFRVTNDTCDNATRLQPVGLQSRVGEQPVPQVTTAPRGEVLMSGIRSNFENRCI